MARVAISGSRVSRQNVQRVLVRRGMGWYTDQDVFCTDIARATGLGGTTASFVVPRLRWLDASDRYAGAEVLVLAGESGDLGTGNRPWFHGWIVGETASFNPADDEYSFTAISVLRMLEKIPVGMNGWTWREWDGRQFVSRVMPGLGARYPRLSRMVDGNRVPLWHPRDVLLDVFRGLPDFWAQAVTLGDTEPLRRAPYERGLVDWDFAAVSIAEALETVLSAYGDVQVIERFEAPSVPRVMLDFYRAGDKGGRKVIRVPGLCGTSNAGQGDIQAIERSDELADRIDRVVLAGARLQVVLTVWTGDPHPSRRLRKGWVVEQVTKRQHYTVADVEYHRDVTKTNEEWVLDDPDYGRRGSDKFEPACEGVFRCYKLPECLMVAGLEVLEDNAFRTIQEPQGQDPKRQDRQVFKTRLTHSTRRTDYEMAGEMARSGRLHESYGYGCGGAYGYGYGYEAADGFRLLNLSAVDLVGDLTADELGPDGLAVEQGAIWAGPDGYEAFPFDLIGSGIRWTTTGTLWMEEPCTVELMRTWCGDEEIVVRGEADVAVTLTVAYPDRLTIDTGQPPYEPGQLSLVGKDGSVLAQVKEEWEYSQLTNLGSGPEREPGSAPTFPIVDPRTGEVLVFDWVMYQSEYDPDADNPDLAGMADKQLIVRHVIAQEPVRDDSPVMRELAGRLLKSRSRKRRSYSVTLPVATRAYEPGDRVEIAAAGVPWDDYIVQGVSVEFDPQGLGWHTRLTVDNQKPEEEIGLET